MLRAVRVAAALALLTACSAPAVAQGWEVAGRVVHVQDGDTLTILDEDRRQHKIRLSGIDAPELGQPFGRSSRRVLVDLAVGRQAAATCHKRDRYEREVCTVSVDGVDVGQQIVGEGMAWVFTRYASELPRQQRLAYQAGQEAARAGRTGLWADAEPVAPWDWRKAHPRGKGDAG